MISEPDFNKLYLNPSFKRKVLGRIASILKKVPYLLDKEDLFQDVFLKIWQNRDKYDPQQSPLEVWAYTVAENTIANTVKSEARRVSREAPPDIRGGQPVTRGPSESFNPSPRGVNVQRSSREARYL
jgi:RNA polymerase sigma factor (sigma-70 family)